MSRARAVFHEKVRTADGIIVEFRVWQVTMSAHYPDGFKYSLFASRDGTVLVGYDNHAPKGHHRHFGSREEVYEFDGLEKLSADFRKDLARARGRIAEGD
jgi:hypothetical protein